MDNRETLLTGLGVGAAGAALVYLFDPDRGGRRRARIRDVVAHGTNVAADAIGTTVRDAANRTYGTASVIGRSIRRDAVDDRVLLERVRATIGRAVSHPHAIDVGVSDGCVTLGGPVLQAETRPLLAAVGRVRGVRELVNNLDEHKTAAGVPALQGGSPRRPRADILQEQWSPTTRVLGGVAGAALVGYGMSRRDVAGAFIASGGASLAACAGTNLGIQRLTGVGAGRRAVDIQKTINVAAPLENVFEFWSAYENFPRFMENVRDVRQTARPGHSHWTVSGPAGSTIEFDARLTEFVPNKVIAWKTVEGSAIGHAGVVRFDRSGAGTRVHIRMSYNPPAGVVGHAAAWLFGADPKTQMDADLARMKTLLETGIPPRDAARRESRL
jgi:uncharacterized membrane protein/osmotically-inducible protein OsmY